MNFKKYFPILTWLPNYKKEDLSGDLAAGFTVGVMLIPQGMAYAMIAGLPPVYGLYAAMIPQVVYALFGTSRQLAVGPVAMDSLLVAAGISTFAVAGTDNYITLAILLAFMMGVIQLAFGIGRLGFLVNFLSKPVISGFTSAAAIIIGVNQLNYLLDVPLVKSSFIIEILWDVVLKVNQYNWWTISLGFVGILIVKYAKKIHRLAPGALVAVVFGILFVKFSHLKMDIVGEIPSGIPVFSLPDFTSSHLTDLIPIAFTLALIAFMESISVAKAIQEKHKDEYEIKNNQELIGLGMGNIVGAFFGCYPTTGGFARSAVNDQSGAKTNITAVFSAILVGLVLLFLTPLFYFLPKTILASIILVAVYGLIDSKYPRQLWNTNKQDFYMLAATFLVTLFLGIKEGIGAGVLLSLGLLIYRTSLPHIAVLGRLPHTTDYRNITRFKEIEIRKDVLVIRQDGQLFFANINHFLDTIKQEVANKNQELRLLVLHCGSISHIDNTALQVLKDLITDLQKQQIEVSFSGVIGPVRDYLHRTNFMKEFGKTRFYLDVQSAIDDYDHPDTKSDKAKFKHASQTNVFKEREV